MTETVSAQSDQVSEAAVRVIAEVQVAIGRRVSQARLMGNEKLAAKWSKEHGFLTRPSYAQALADASFDTSTLENLAIYATEKMRRLTGFFVGEGTVDPYTRTLLNNLSAFQAEGRQLANRLMNAALSKSLRASEALVDRRAASEATAITQASSTRQALVALGAGSMQGGHRSKTFQVDVSHPFVAKVLEA